MKHQNNLVHHLRISKRPEWLAFVLALCFGLMSAILVPQMSVNDEAAHFLKAYSLASGKLYGTTCTFPLGVLAETNSLVMPNNFTDTVNYDDTTVTTCGSAANYSPIMHAPQALGIATGKLFHAPASALVLLGRLANAIFYAFMLFFIVRLAPLSKWVFVVIGLFPLMIHTAGSLSGDTMNNVVVLLYFAYLLTLFTQRTKITRGQILAVIGLCVAIALTKMTNVFLLLPLAALPMRLFSGKPKVSFNNPHVRKWLMLSACGLATLAFILVSQNILGSSLFIRDIPYANPLLSHPERAFTILWNTYLNAELGYTDLILRGIVGEFSSFKYHLPTFLVLAQLGLFAFVLFLQEDIKNMIDKKYLKTFASLSAISLVIFVLAITFALYSAWAIAPWRLGPNAHYADGVQGRYFTAALIALIPVAAWLKSYFRVSVDNERTVWWVVFMVSGGNLMFYILQTYFAF